MYFLLDFGTYFVGLYLASTGYLFKSIPYFIVTLYSFSVAGSLGGTAAHELFHKREWYHRLVGTLSYTKVLYSHFIMEHTKGHHYNVATPNDPATAKLGETIYEFFPKSLIGGFLSAW